MRGSADKAGRLGERLTAPMEKIARTESRLEVIFERMAASMRQRLETAGQQLEQASRLLESTSFQRTLIAASQLSVQPKAGLSGQRQWPPRAVTFRSVCRWSA